MRALRRRGCIVAALVGVAAFAGATSSANSVRADNACVELWLTREGAPPVYVAPTGTCVPTPFPRKVHMWDNHQETGLPPGAVNGWHVDLVLTGPPV